MCVLDASVGGAVHARVAALALALVWSHLHEAGLLLRLDLVVAFEVVFVHTLAYLVLRDRLILCEVLELSIDFERFVGAEFALGAVEVQFLHRSLVVGQFVALGRRGEHVHVVDLLRGHPLVVRRHSEGEYLECVVL